MSTKLLTLAYKMPLNLTEKSVLAALTFTVNNEGFGFPGYKDLLEKTGIGSKSTLAKTIAILEGAGFFTKKAHAKIGDGRKVNTYQLLFNETWFEFIPQEGLKSPRPVLIESIRTGLIEKINKLRDDKKRTISTRLVPRKVHTSPLISTQAVHESSLNRHSESSLNIYSEEKSVNKVDKKQPTKPATKTTIPDDFMVTDGVFTWYREKGFTEDINLHFENFKDQCQAKGYEYINFDSAFKTAIRKDWASLRKNTNINGVNNGNYGNGNITKEEWNSLDF